MSTAATTPFEGVVGGPAPAQGPNSQAVRQRVCLRRWFGRWLEEQALQDLHRLEQAELQGKPTGDIEAVIVAAIRTDEQLRQREGTKFDVDGALRDWAAK